MMRFRLRAATVAATLAASTALLGGSPAGATTPAGSEPTVTDAFDAKASPLRDRPDLVRPVAPGSVPPPKAVTPPNSGSTTLSGEVSPQSTGPGAAAKAAPYDFNGDGYRDMVVGSPGENLGTATNAGMIHVLYGAATGLSGAGSVGIHQDTPGVPGSPEDDDQFGFSNTSGDFNADGYADAAVSANAESLGSAKYAGLVLVFYGSPTGLRTDTATSLSVARSYQFFGDSLAAGDFNADGRDDLAIGGPWYGSGSVFVFNGGDTGLSTTYQEYWQGMYGVPGSSDTDDGFGWSLAAGDINGDGASDLAIGAIYDWEDKGWSTGSVTVLYGHTSGLNYLSDGERWTKQTTGVPGGGGRFDPDNGDWSDILGHQVVLADFSGDGKADLVIAAPGAPVYVDGVRKRDAGTLTVLYSNGSRIGTTGAKEVTQQTAGMPGTAGYEDQFGATLAAGDANGDRIAELAVYSCGDNYVTVVPGANPGGFAYTSAKAWTQNSSGIPGSTEAGDRWGNSLRFLDIKNTGYAALLVGADGENNNRGAMTVIYSGGSSGLTGTGSRYLDQDSTGISGTAEAGDWFGLFF